MRWMVSVRYILVIVSVLFGTFAAVILARNCNGLLNSFKMQDTLLVDGQFDEGINFPCKVKGTELIAVAMINYEGTFLEDGGESEVVDVAALLLRNNTDKHIYDGQVEVKQRGRSLIFQITHLPGNGEILVIEKHRQPYHTDAVLGCEGVVRQVSNNGWSEKFSVIPTGQRGLIVKNLTDQQFVNVVVYYKTYYAPAGFYVGGITHSVKIDTIGAHEEVQLIPRPFISEGSAVVWVSEDG